MIHQKVDESAGRDGFVLQTSHHHDCTAHAFCLEPCFSFSEAEDCLEETHNSLEIEFEFALKLKCVHRVILCDLQRRIGQASPGIPDDEQLAVMKGVDRGGPRILAREGQRGVFRFS